ncbi:DapH/DapD/GlmU-related protein [Chryseobacterium sp. MDT2-18]|uniref:acyltransferase n=1 Tax=Chryseobacterium sp. MDT2-18 TaxID=1259136 RepID=UPI00277E909E|nr:acyltransferase [Chryseobacterium sp. MDT2-18]MDQ0478164.1 acetyltransferase-like isoleucine patch superfamily enzyme [Chryseobacterium sp. MDT2-18]
MTGRESFKKYHPIIAVLGMFFSVFGRKGNLFLLKGFRHTSGKVGLVLRYVFLKNAAEFVGENVSVQPGVYLLNVQNLHLGNNVSIHPMCYIDAKGGIKIGNDVSVAHGSSVLSTNHDWTDRRVPIKYNTVQLEKVIIEDDVWIGCGVRILAGVHIGSRSVIAAGSVVSKNVASNTIVAGVPARMVKTI